MTPFSFLREFYFRGRFAEFCWVSLNQVGMCHSVRRKGCLLGADWVQQEVNTQATQVTPRHTLRTKLGAWAWVLPVIGGRRLAALQLLWNE